MEDEKLRIADLIVRQFCNTINKEEEQMLNEWRHSTKSNEDIFNEILYKHYYLSHEDDNIELDQEWQKVAKRISVESKNKDHFLHVHTFLKYACVFIPIACVVAVLWFYEIGMSDDILKNHDRNVDISRAYLIQDDEYIELKGTKTKLEDGKVVLENNISRLCYIENTKTKHTKINRLVVPRGCEYQVELADGTLVFLNSESELRYPTAFNSTVRTIELKGEAYFKVAKDTTKPMIVKVGNMQINVLGTEFNINSYTENDALTATLVNGLIDVSIDGRQYTLKPNHQLRYSVTKKDITMKEVNTALYTSWKDGKFLFNHITLSEIMIQISRWYNVEYVFEDNEIRELKIFSIINKYDDIMQIVDILNQYDSFSIRYSNNKLTIKNKML